MVIRILSCAPALALVCAVSGADAASPAEIRDGYATSAKAAGSAGLSASRGEQFFKSTHGREWTCATCHGARPLGDGKHAVTGKVISPLAPIANAARFTDPAKTEKWFKRNCNDVVGRECTAAEKGDVLEYLLSLKNG